VIDFRTNLRLRTSLSIAVGACLIALAGTAAVQAEDEFSWAEAAGDPTFAGETESGTGYISVANELFLEEDDTAPALDDFDERLKTLESAWEEHQESLKKTADAAKSKPTFKINGRIHLDYWAYPDESAGIGFFEHPVAASPNFGDDPEDSFLFRRIRLEMGGDILETMLYRVQVDFNNSNDPELKDVYLGFKELPGNQRLLIGIQKRPIGLDHLNSSRYNVFLERPFVVESFNEDARRLGVAMYGHTENETYNWTYGVFNAENITSSDGRYFGDAYQLSFNARLASSPWYDETSDGRGYFHWALATMIQRTDGNNPPGATNGNEARFRTRPEARTMTRWLDTGAIPGAEWYEIAAAESILNIGPLQIVGEYQHNWLQRDDSTPGTGPDLAFHGGYIYVSYFLTGENIPYERDSGTIGRVVPFENFFVVDRCDGGVGHGWGAWNVALRYSYLDLTDGDIAGGIGESWTGALNWHWTPFSKMQFNLIYGEIDEHAPVGGFTSGHYLIAGTRFAIEF
jgi:phosphate-selective porin OprO/OprP